MKTPFFIRCGRVAITLGLLVECGVGAAEVTPSSLTAPGVVIDAKTPAVETPHVVSANRAVPVAQTVQLTTADRIRQLRVFDEPLVAVGPAGQPADADDLLALLERQEKTPTPLLISEYQQYADTHLTSPWRAALALNLGYEYRKQGYFARALSAWQVAWALTKDDSGNFAGKIGSRALAEIIQLNAWVGRQEELAVLFKLADGRSFEGQAEEKLAEARRGWSMMINKPEVSFKCGPYSIDLIRQQATGDAHPDERVLAYRSTAKGTNLVEVRDFAKTLGYAYAIVYRPAGEQIVVPSVVNWKLQHYSAILKVENGKYLVRDSTMDRFYGQLQWLDAAAINEGASGYFLVPADKVPAGWRVVPDTEGLTVFGRGNSGGVKPVDAATPCDVHAGSGGCNGMMSYDLNPLYASLRLRDIPLEYDPPRGPGISIAFAYNEAVSSDPTIFTSANLGPKWAMNWLASVEAPQVTGTTITSSMHTGGGGQVPYTGTLVNATASIVNVPLTSYVRPDVVTVKSVDPINYLIEVEHNDGSIDSYGQSDGGIGSARRLFLTRRADPLGNAVTLTYETVVGAGLRLKKLTDAIGQETTLSYDVQDPLKIIRVTDPFGRTTQIGYTAGQLSSITDAVGMVSSVTYESNSSKAASLTTPYGTSTFARGGNGIDVWLEATDPYGDRQRIEFTDSANVPNSDQLIPQGVPLLLNDWLQYRNGFYWDKKAMRKGPGDYSKAFNYHYLHSRNGGASRILESVKPPLESRVWFTYPGQTALAYDTNITFATPAITARVLDDGSTQLTSQTFNSRGRVATATDPLGRTTNYGYGLSDTLLGNVYKQNGTFFQYLTNAEFTPPNRQITSVTDAAGNKTLFTYHPTSGMLQTITNAKGEKTTLVYDALGNFVQEIQSPIPGVKTTLTYDGFNRVRTVTGPDGYTTTQDYDNLNRPTKVTYPDGTTEQVVWDKLDPVILRDRQGRMTRQFFNKLGQLTAVTDPQGRTTQFAWCRCGHLDSLIDPLGNITQWTYDLQARTLSKTYNNQNQELYTYEPMSGRLATVTDALGQVKTMSYYRDDRLGSVTYTNSVNATAPVSFSYESTFGRLAAITDVTGTTNFSYNTYGTNGYTVGGLQLASLSNVTTKVWAAYGYDVLGRVSNRTRYLENNPTLNPQSSSVVYDALGRVTTQTNTLGSFGYTYDGGTGRVSQMTGPFGFNTQYSYLNASQDFKLQSITNKVNTTAVSSFAYAYVPQGQIQSITRQFDAAAATTWNYGYDQVEQVISADLSGAAPKSLGFGYDANGNRVVTQEGNQVTASVFNKVNQLVTSGIGQATVVRGSTNEAAKVSINGAAVASSVGKTFTATIPSTPGATTFSVTAQDGSGNSTTHTYQATVTAGVGVTSTYDANGNLLSDGTSTYQWDAENRLISITKGTLRSNFAYDGLGRRIRITEYQNNVVTSDLKFFFVGLELVEIRDSADVALERYYPQGFETGVKDVVPQSTKYLYTRDHLGSVYEAIRSDGVVAARYDYSVYGERTKVSGAIDVRMGYTGHYQHAASGLALTLFRAYDPRIGRWLSRDPIGEAGGINLYAYVDNSPLGLIDPLGLCDDELAAGYIGAFDGATFGLVGWLAFDGEERGYLHQKGTYLVGSVVGGVAATVATGGMGAIGAGVSTVGNVTRAGMAARGAVAATAVGAGSAARTVSLMTNAQATAAAAKLGYQPTKLIIAGQKVFKCGGKYISRDVGSSNGLGSHNGGAWKMFEMYRGKLRRLGTVDENLNDF